MSGIRQAHTRAHPEPGAEAKTEAEAATTLRIAQRLRRRSKELRERELLQAGLEEPGPFTISRVPVDRLQQAFVLKRALLAEFAGARLDDLYAIEEQETELGPVLKLVERRPVPLALPTPEEAENILERELRLLYGIGPRIASELRARGYTTIRDLKRHERFRAQATELLERLERRDLGALWRRIERFLFRTHPATLALAALAGPDELLFLDLESLGLFGRPLVLIGLACYDRQGQELSIEQYVIRSIVEEQAVLAAVQREMDRAQVLISYNGRAFDMNYLEERLSYYGLYNSFCDSCCDSYNSYSSGSNADSERDSYRLSRKPHLDLLHHARRYLAGSLPDCRLETIERYILKLERPLDIPSILVPDFYNTYLEERNIGPLVAIIEHNKQDLLSLALLLNKLCSESLFGLGQPGEFFA